MLKQIEEMSERNATFDEYYHLTFKAMDELKGNSRALALYAIMNQVRQLGFDKGERAANEAMKKFLNCS